jgi:FkbM family methyltransferase
MPSVRASVVGVAERVQRLAETLLTPGGPRALRTWRPFSLAAFRLVRSLQDDGWRFATVIDVGANAGQFTRAALGAWPGARVVAFEPLPEAADRLAAMNGAVGDIEVHRCAVGATDGTTTFFPHRHSLSSSVLRVASGAGDLPWAEELPGLAVDLRRLDTVLAGRTLARPALLKLDVQGFELEVVNGGADTLAQVDALLVETAFVPGYEGQPTFAAVDRVLSGSGWSLARPLDVRRERDGRIVEADCLYRRVVPE